jgi:hypothetical protein
MLDPVLIRDRFLTAPQLQPKFWVATVLTHMFQQMVNSGRPLAGKVIVRIKLRFRHDLPPFFEPCPLLICVNMEVKIHSH